MDDDRNCEDHLYVCTAYVLSPTFLFLFHHPPITGAVLQQLYHYAATIHSSYLWKLIYAILFIFSYKAQVVSKIKSALRYTGWAICSDFHIIIAQGWPIMLLLICQNAVAYVTFDKGNISAWRLWNFDHEDLPTLSWLKLLVSTPWSFLQFVQSYDVGVCKIKGIRSVWSAGSIVSLLH
jgi:hypothetical protein